MPQHSFAVRHVDNTDPFLAMTRSFSDKSSTLSRSKRMEQTGQHSLSARHLDNTDPFLAITRSLSDKSSNGSRKSTKLMEQTGLISAPPVRLNVETI